jgi:hypothetical protein
MKFRVRQPAVCARPNFWRTQALGKSQATFYQTMQQGVFKTMDVNLYAIKRGRLPFRPLLTYLLAL